MLEERLLSRGESLHAPHLMDVEVAQVLRRYATAGELTPERGREALIDLADFPVHRYPHDVLLPRIWELRYNVTTYDATYLALAETLVAPLVTCDRRLGSEPRHAAKIEVFGSAVNRCGPAEAVGRRRGVRALRPRRERERGG